MDAFAVLDLPRAPWVDAELVKERFHRLGATHHPDAPGGSGDAFSELNSAWQILRDPAACLRHFLQLTAPSTLTSAISTPLELGELFMEIAGLKQAINQYLTAKSTASSPLAKALIEPHRLALETRINTARATVKESLTSTEITLQHAETSITELASILARLTFLTNWQRRLEEDRVRLA